MISQRKYIGQFSNADPGKWLKTQNGRKKMISGTQKPMWYKEFTFAIYVMCGCPSEYSFDKI